MFPVFFWILLLTYSIEGDASVQKVRRVSIAQDQIEIVRTAIGIATIVQVPDRPNSVVVGDQGAFKVEYLDQAITIKPLRGSAKSNLYIYTDWRRYNVQLVTGSEATADYVVYLENPKESLKPTKSSLSWIRVRRSLSNEGLSLEVKRLGRSRDGMLLIDFVLQSKKSEAIQAESFWLTQSGTTKPIQLLYLSAMSIEPRSPVSGMMQVLQSDISETESLRLELRRKKTSSLILPKVASWN